MNILTVNTANVRVMKSHDYCHFEICLGLTTEPGELINLSAVDDLRKEAARLADKAVEQYKVAKRAFSIREMMAEPYRLKMSRQLEETDRTPEDKARIKFAEDAEFAARFDYDYEDEWDEPGF